MNLTHLHLLLNHFPTTGLVVGLGLFVIALASRSDDLKRVSLGVFLILALLSIPAYLTGNAAAEAIEGRQDVSAAMIERHQDGALLAFLLMEATGAAAWLGLWRFRRSSHPGRAGLIAVLALSIVTLALMTWAGTLGGEILHTEIRPGGMSVSAEGEGWSTAVALFVTGRTWVWPASETLHFIGMGLLLSVVLLVNLRILGVVKRMSFADLHRLLPWGLLGFGLNLVTGMLFFIAAPGQYTQNVAFHLKVILIVLAGINVLYFTVFEEPWALKAGDEAPPRAKVIAASTLLIWFGVIYFGRMLPFIGGAF